MKQKNNIVQSLRLADGCEIVLYDWDALSDHSTPRVWENIECFLPNGERKWTINGFDDVSKFDTKTDVFVGVRLVGGVIVVNTFSGNDFSVDAETGEIDYFGFSK